MYYKTRLKPSERPNEKLEYAVLDGYGHVIAYCEAEEFADEFVQALNEYGGLEASQQE